jgi:hypothetical protein
MSPSSFDTEMKELYEQSVGRLLNAEHFDLQAFDSFYSYLCTKATHIKNEPVVSKQVLQYLLQAQGAIESRAEYMPLVRQHIQLSNKFVMLLRLIANGEDCAQRVPGVPRVI